MRFFALLDFQYLVPAWFIGLVGAILAYKAWGSMPAAVESVETPADHEAAKPRIAPVLIYLYTGIVLWALGYVFYIMFIFTQPY